MRYFFIDWFVFLQDALFKRLAKRRDIHRALFTPHFESYRWYVGRWRMMRTYHQALHRVPAYAKFIRKQRGPEVLPLRWLSPQIAEIPAMDKESYIRQYSIEDRCLDGELPRTGVVVDESSGSSGKPTSWVRGPEERLATRLLLQVTFARSIGAKPQFVLNAFALGAWATGMNVSMSLIDLCIMKSTGPDIDKIINTMLEFGPKYSYVILGYPPFLKNLVDDGRIDFSQYDVTAGFGGEGMSENMRTYLLKFFRSVYGSYGASDLEINMAIETPFAIALRQTLSSDEALAADVIRTDYAVLPMIFQYNPYEYVIESNANGELLASISRRENISPRIRYNIHDRGHVMRLGELAPILRKHGHKKLLQQAELDLPLLFHYGRSDLSVDFYGAVVPPDSIREIIYDIPALAKTFSNFRMISYEDQKTNKQLHIAIELQPGASRAKAAQFGPRIIAAERQKNRDFDHACAIAKRSTLPTINFYEHGQGPFALDHGKLKNEYVWHLSYADTKPLNLVTND